MSIGLYEEKRRDQVAATIYAGLTEKVFLYIALDQMDAAAANNLLEKQAEFSYLAADVFLAQLSRQRRK